MDVDIIIPAMEQAVEAIVNAEREMPISAVTGLTIIPAADEKIQVINHIERKPTNTITQP